MEQGYIKAESQEEIKAWVEKNGGKPAILDDPEVKSDRIGLRIDWPGARDEQMLSGTRESTRDISWDEFFTIMETHNLDFIYSDDENKNLTWRYKFVPIV